MGNPFFDFLKLWPKLFCTFLFIFRVLMQSWRTASWRPGSDHLTWGPMRGLKKNNMKRGQTDRHTSQLLDQLGPEGRVGENHKSIPKGSQKYPKISQKYPKIILNVSQKYTTSYPKIDKNYPKTIPRESHKYPKSIPKSIKKLSKYYPKSITKISQN